MLSTPMGVVPAVRGRLPRRTGQVRPFRGKVVAAAAWAAFTWGAAGAAWWTEALTDARKLGRPDAVQIDGRASNLAQKVAALRGAGLPDAQALRWHQGKALAKGPGDTDVVIATAAAGGALVLTEAGRALAGTAQWVVAESDLPRLRSLLEQSVRQSGRTAYVAYPQGTLGRVLLRQTGSGESLFVERYPGVFAPAERIAALGPALAQPLRVDKAKVVSLLDASDADVLLQLDRAVGEQHLRAGSRSQAGVLNLVGSQKRGIVFVVGHVEGDEFIVRSANGERRAAVGFAQLEQAARQKDVSLVFLGCGTAVCSRSTGFAQPVNATEVASGLRSAMAQRTVGEALSVIAQQNSELLLDGQIAGSLQASMRALRQSEAVDRRIASAYPVVRVATLSRERSEELQARIIPFLPAWIQMTYVAGFLFLLFSLRGILRDWRGFRRPAPAFRTDPYRRALVGLVRSSGFMLLMPLATLVSVLGQAVIYAFGAGALILVLGWAAPIALYYGNRWRKLHRENMADEPFQLRYLPLPLMALLAAIPGGLVLLLAPGIGASPSAWALHSGTDLLAHGVKCLLVAASCHLLWRWLSRHKTRRAPGQIAHYVLAAPLLGIEHIVNRIIDAPRSA